MDVTERYFESLDRLIAARQRVAMLQEKHDEAERAYRAEIARRAAVKGSPS